MVATNLWPLCSLVSTHFLLSVSFDGVCCVSLLPQKLSGTQEWLRVLELPPLQKVRRTSLYFLSWIKQMGRTPSPPTITLTHTHHNITPLVHFNREVAMRLYPFSKRGVHHCFWGWTNGNRLGQFWLATFCYPGNLWCKVSNMFLLLLESILWDKHREINILYPELFNFSIKEC